LTAASKTLLYKTPKLNRKITKRKPKPWMSNDISLLKREVRKLGRRIQIAIYYKLSQMVNENLTE
jgi:hypothetical protein